MAATLSFAQHLDGTGLRVCFDYWLTRRQGDRLPTKRAICPSTLPRAIMSDLFLYELTPEERFKCRLAGSAIRRAFGKEPTGLHLDEIVNAASAAARTALFRATLDREMPVVYGGTLVEGEKLWMPFRRLLLPVAADDGTARFVFGMVIFPRLADLGQACGNAEELTLEFEAWSGTNDLTARATR